ncbi:uncharacterized protein LOC131244289 [Magnolia sinica]|uniref:uncharacterized protein LOC131244289 n=1 Tax=Magnolia sinica TaxID=86752 RepID=UPI0026591BE3|nr:uncharacterized protein LOC131244289 [Magnolia sinica]
MENDGNLVIYERDGKAIWSSASISNTKDGDYALILRRDRNVVIYGSILWSTNTTDSLAVGNWTTGRSPFNIISQGGDNATVQSSSTGGIGQGGANAMSRRMVHRAQAI